MKYHLICGYKRSGKDTFYNYLSKGNITEYTDSNKCEESEKCFYILTKPGHIEFQSIKSNPTRIAMASIVKEEIHAYFQIKFKSKELEELAKDNLLFFDEEKAKYKTLREYYIEHAMKMRYMDCDHWCKSAWLYLLMNGDEDDNDIIITDWRFPNEKIFFQNKGDALTYRIFREEADDENFFDSSEHSLDSESTDFLVVGKKSDVIKAKAKFPQYEGYEIKYKINL
jgi:hypothetical protein